MKQLSSPIASANWMRVSFVMLAFVGAVLSTSVSAVAQSLAPPQQVIKDTSDHLLSVMQTERDKLDADPTFVYDLANEVMIESVDFRRMCAMVLGKNWRKATPEQKDRFADAFQRLLVRTYATAFRDLDDWEITFKPLRAKDGAKDVWVHTEVLANRPQPVKVSYRMRLRDGQWRAYDVQIEGISLVTNYRNTFAREVKQGGIDSLISRIEKLNDTRVQEQKPVQVSNTQGKAPAAEGAAPSS